MAQQSLFSTYDPRRSYVVLYANRYVNHIENRHPGITVEAIQETIENPDMIFSDADDVLVEVYYAKGVTGISDVFLKVCVRIEGATGKVLTAYEVNKPKPAEKKIWPK